MAVTEVIMPALGDTMDEGTITAWHKKVGEWVEKGELLLEVLTDKADIQVESTSSGYLRAILHDEGATVPVTRVIAYLADSLDEPLPEEATAAPARPAPAATPATAEPAVEAPPEPELPPHRAERIKASPRARRLAEERGVDLRLVAPSSRSGRIVEADVRRYLEEQARAPAPTPAVAPPPTPSPRPALAPRTIPFTGVRKVIAERMAQSHREVARVTLFTEADATELVALRRRLNERQGDVELTYTDLLIKIVAVTLKRHPVLNSSLAGDEIHLHDAVHMGVAVDTERGLIVPVVRDADSKGLAAISRETRDLAERARAGRLGPDEMRGSTFTMTNLGTYDVDGFTPIVNPPETAILGVGRIVSKPVVQSGKIVAREMVTLSLSFDHRVVDGGPAARFLQEVKRLIEEPGLLLM